MNRYILNMLFAVVLTTISVSCFKDDAVNPDVEKNRPGNNASGYYSLSVSAGRVQDAGQNVGTRAEVDLDDPDYLYYWSAGTEEMVLTVTPSGSTTAVTDLNRITMESTNATRVLDANFRADLSADQFHSLSLQSRIDLYSYYPADINGLNNSTFPANLQFSIPSSFSVVPNEFIDAKFAPMVAIAKNQEPIIALPPNQTAPVEEIGGVHLDYDHVMSYAAIEMDVRLMPDKVRSITMTVGTASNAGTWINGNYSYNLSTGTGTLSGGSNSVTVTIPTGLDAGDVIYIPMPVKNLTGQTFNFTFTMEGSTGRSYRNLTAIAGNLNFEKGKIHPIKVAPAAQYAAGTSFTVTKSGYYYIEAWGGRGGTGSGSNGSRTGGAGGMGATIRGLYYLNENEVISIQVGAAGKDASGQTNVGAGGTTLGASYGLGNGGRGGNGGNQGNNITGFAGNAGAGGGAASGVLRNGTAVLVAGGGGGGGGASSGTSGILTPSNGGAGGAGGGINSNGGSGGSPSNGRDGNGGNGNGSGGSNGGGSSSAGTGNSGNTGGSGGNGANGSGAYSGGSGGGGAGGGHLNGGGAGGGGNVGGFGSSSGAGGGGAGGASYLAGTANNTPGYSLPTNTWSSADGYVYITFFR